MMKQKLVWLAAGVAVGLVAGGFLPHAPLHAVATDRQDNFAICTCPLDGDQEAVVFLDFLTGDLTATAYNVAVPQPVVGVVYSRNILTDLGVDATKSPKFLMVSGLLQMRPQGQLQFGASVVYVAEITSGKVAAYAMPYNKGRLNQSTGAVGQFQLLHVGPFRQNVVR